MMMTTAELRGRQQICGLNGTIMVIACDQRGGVRKPLAEDKTEQAKISDGMRGDVKIDVVHDLAAPAPAAPLDAVCAAPRVSATTLIRAGLRPSDVARARFDHAVSRQ